MLMDSAYLTFVADVLGTKGITLEPGLSDHELEHLECLAGFRFPPDLGELLVIAPPTGGGLPGLFSVTRILAPAGRDYATINTRPSHATMGWRERCNDATTSRGRSSRSCHGGASRVARQAFG